MASKTLKATCVWKVVNGTSIRAATQSWVHDIVPTFRDGVTPRATTSTRVADLVLSNNHGCNTRKLYGLFILSGARLIKSIGIAISVR